MKKSNAFPLLIPLVNQFEYTYTIRNYVEHTHTQTYTKVHTLTWNLKV